MSRYTNVIAAASTPPGKGGVAVIRMSGDGAIDIAKKVFFPRGRRTFSEIAPRTQVYGDIIEDGEAIDDVLLTVFPAPHSYTGEDTVEISCHGGILVTRCVLEALFRAGAIPAQAGEFTRRAFINGRLTLTEAEAIGELLEAKTREQMRLSSSKQRSLLSGKISELRALITETLSSMYARIDYPDEDLGDFTDAELSVRLGEAISKIERLLSTYRTGRAISEGVSTVICGKPNVGKSSLYNLLLGEDAAIVTSISGTTRDVLTRSVGLGKITLNLADTAGIREGEDLDAVEEIGIRKSREMIEKSELLFAIFDISRPFDDEDKEILSAIENSSAAKIAIINKSDLSPLFDVDLLAGRFDFTVTLSVKDGGEEVISELTEIVDSLFADEKINVKEDAIIHSARQHASITRALDLLRLAKGAIDAGAPQDAVSSDLERALGALSELDGRAVSEEIVADIFSKFCVGK